MEESTGAGERVSRIHLSVRVRLECSICYNSRANINSKEWKLLHYIRASFSMCFPPVLAYFHRSVLQLKCFPLFFLLASNERPEMDARCGWSRQRKNDEGIERIKFYFPLPLVVVVVFVCDKHAMRSMHSFIVGSLSPFIKYLLPIAPCINEIQQEFFKWSAVNFRLHLAL